MHVQEAHAYNNRQIRVDQDLQREKEWSRTCLVQFRMFAPEVVAAARREENDMPFLGSPQDRASSAEERSPITLTDDSPGEQPDAADIPVPTDDEDDPLFWEAWLTEIREDNANDGELQLNARDETEKTWAMVHALAEPPDARYHLNAYDMGVEYAACFAAAAVTNCSPVSPLFTQQERKVAQHLLRWHIQADAEMVALVNAVMAEPAELEIPTSMAYLSGLIGDEALSETNSVVLLQWDKQGARNALIAGSRTQSNLNVTDDDLRKHPKLVASAVLAELLRWIENCSFRRRPRREANNILSSRYVLTWKRQSDGSRAQWRSHCLERRDLERICVQTDRGAGLNTPSDQVSVQKPSP